MFHILSFNEWKGDSIYVTANSVERLDYSKDGDEFSNVDAEANGDESMDFSIA